MKTKTSAAPQGACGGDDNLQGRVGGAGGSNPGGKFTLNPVPYKTDTPAAGAGCP